MTILASYASFRNQFAAVARTTGVSLTYNAGPPSTITRGSGSFVTDGFITGQSVDVSGTTSNDGRYTVDTVAALTLTLSTDDALSAEGPVTSSLTGAFYENDGAEQWPVANVRAGGFSSTWSMLPRPITKFPVAITINGGVTDASAGSSYTWYVRQRTDDPSLQWIDVVAPANPLVTGTIDLDLNATCVAALGLSGVTAKLTTEQQVRVLRDVWIFVKRNSDGAIQLVDLFQLSHANTE